jgi:TatA/E family protein of Tat protein translocase
MFDIGSGEVLLVAVLALLLFGKELPEVARSAGRSLAGFKRSLTEGLDDPPRDGPADPDKKT